MNRFPLVCSLIALFLSAAGSGKASGQDWARKMFSEVSHDFGVVAAGSETVHRFEFENLYEEDVHIASVRSSCGCTTPSIEKDLVKTKEKGAIVAKFNTQIFRGPKQATLTVLIDRPFRAEVQLIVRGNIQGNVSFEPGSVQFGDIMVGTGATRTVRMIQRGNPGWEILDVKTTFDDKKVKVRLRGPDRTVNSVSYDISVELADSIEQGYVNGELFIETNDGIRYPLNFSGRIAAPLELSPNLLPLAPLAPGEVVKRRILLRAERPFRITRIETTDADLSLTAQNKQDKLHVIEVMYRAGPNTGNRECLATITTDLGQSMTAKLRTVVMIEAPNGASEGEAASK
jgi:Protein of unknown function (DUF1573)